MRPAAGHLVCEDLERASEAPAIVARLAGAFDEPFATHGTELHVAASARCTEEALIASTVTNAKVSGYWAIGSDGKVYGFGGGCSPSRRSSAARRAASNSTSR